MDFIKGSEEYLFENNLKPALLYGKNHKYVEYFKEQYAFIEVDELRIIFYHTEQTLETWNKELRKRKDKAQAIGTVLGYPPQAVKKFSKEVSEITNPIRINYHGLRFVSSSDCYKEDLKWLMLNQPIPTEHQTIVELNYPDESGRFSRVKKLNLV